MAQAVAPAKKKLNPQQHIKVVCRIRPLSEQELEDKIRNVLTVEGNNVIKTKDKRYQFDRVFKPDSTQMDIYLYVVSPMINDVLSGYNCTVFAYGQTGTGKTFTMTGGDRDFIVNNWREDPLAGCIPRAAANIFDQITSMGTATDYNVRVSFLELYNEEVRDLLSDEERPSPLNVLSDTKGTVCIQGLKEITVNNRTDIFELLDKGTAKRQTAATLMNNHSSRSHTVFTITVHARETSVTGEDVLKTGKINLVDLAGSENIAKSGAKDQRAVELANINKSLLTLGRVIQNLVDKVKHVPYRDSKLTRILQDSLGGHTKTCIIATVSGAHTSYEETVSTLDYASRARDIKNYPTVNEKFTKAQIMKEMNKEIEKLKRDLDAARSGEGFYVDKDNWEHMQTVYQTVQLSNQEKEERIHSLEERIGEMEEVLVEKVRNFDTAVDDCKKFKSICAKQKIVIQRQKLVIDQEKFIADVYQETAEEKGKECVWLIDQYNDLQKDYFTLLNKVDSLYETNKVNETLFKDTMKRFTDTAYKVNEISNEYFTKAHRTAERANTKRQKLREQHEKYHNYIKLVMESYTRLSEPFESIDTALDDVDSPINRYCLRTKLQCERDSQRLMLVQSRLQEHQKLVTDLLDNIAKGMNLNFDTLKQELEGQLNDLENVKQEAFKQHETFANNIEGALLNALEQLSVMRDNHKSKVTADMEATREIAYHIVRSMDNLQTSATTNCVEANRVLNDDLYPVIDGINDINVTQYYTYATDSAAHTLEIASHHNDTVRAMLSSVDSMMPLTQSVLNRKDEIIFVTDSYHSIIDDLKNATNSYSMKLNEATADIKQFTATAIDSVKENQPTGQTPRAARTQMTQQGETAPPPREVLLRRFAEENPVLSESQDKENNLNLSNCTATTESFLNSSTELD